MGTTLIIPAAGRGTRFGSQTPKQFIQLGNKPVLAWSLAAFSGLVDEAIVAVSDEARAEVEKILAVHPCSFPVRIVRGGDTRQQSVAAALAITQQELILVHDAVRPLVPRRCIEACLAALAQHCAAVVAVACAATVKRVANGMVDSTLSREGLYLAQTPQGFRRDAGRIAFARAQVEGWECSDDAQVLERAGYAVALVAGDARNLKLTTRDDLALAEALIAMDLDQRVSPLSP